jgi:hypothetical protein
MKVYIDEPKNQMVVVEGRGSNLGLKLGARLILQSECS